MSEMCSHCGTVTRGGACSEFDSRRRELEELSTCPNASDEQQRYAREEYARRYLGWDRS